MNVKKINEFVQHVIEAMPEGLKNLPQDLQKNLRAAVQVAFSKMELVTREEFDVQTQVLQRTRQKLEMLEKQVTELADKLRNKPEPENEPKEKP